MLSKLRNKIDRSARKSLGRKINHDIRSVKETLILIKNDDVNKINLKTTNQSWQVIPWHGNYKRYTIHLLLSKFKASYFDSSLKSQYSINKRRWIYYHPKSHYIILIP
jgi:hypothetical protein